MSNESGEMYKEVVVAYYPGICLEEPRKSINTSFGITSLRGEILTRVLQSK
jgi:hypothetical protein